MFFARLTSFAPASAPNDWLVIFNGPAGVLERGSKAFLCHFPDFTAPVRRVQSKLEVQRFAEKHPIVLKPLEENGGHGIVRIMDGKAEEDEKQFMLDEWLEKARKDVEAWYYLGMKFIKNVSAGDNKKSNGQQYFKNENDKAHTVGLTS